MWLARDRNGKLYLYAVKPLRGKYEWIWGHGDKDSEIISVKSKDYDFVKWESDPIEVILTPKPGKSDLVFNVPDVKEEYTEGGNGTYYWDV